MPTTPSWHCEGVLAAVEGLSMLTPTGKAAVGGASLRSYLLQICCPLLVLCKQVPVLCPLDNFVVHICHVHDIQDAVAKVVLQYAAHNVKGDIVSRVAQVGSIIHSGSTGVPGQLPAGIAASFGVSLGGGQCQGIRPGCSLS